MNSQSTKDYIQLNAHLPDKQLSQLTGQSVRAIKSIRCRNNLRKRDLLKDLFEKTLESEGIDSKWKHGWLKTDNASIFVRNEKGILSYEEMRDELLESMKKYSPRYPTIKRSKITEGHCLVIDPADVHIGKLALQEETNNEYNIKIAKERCIEGVKGILNKAQGFPIEKIVFVIGNDVLHTDNPFRTTTAGTKQDTDGQWWQMFKEAKDMYIKIIEHLVVIADVHIVFCPSNHDYASGFMLSDSLASWFHASKNIHFDVNIVHRKYFQYGLNLLSFSHGDGAKEQDTPLLMASEQKKMWSETTFRYIYLHHIHHKKQIKWQSGKDYLGATVQYLRSPSASDGWSTRNGYIAPKAVEGFIHSKKHGQIATLTNYF